MRKVRSIVSRLRALVRSRRISEDLRDEIAGHLDEATEDFIRQGLSPAEARRAAHRSFGGVTQAEEAYREGVSFQFLDRLRGDLRHTLRALCRHAGFACAVVVVVALGTGGVISVFALLNSIVFRPLPYPDADALVVVKHSAPGLNVSEVGLSSGLYQHYAVHSRSLDSIAVYMERTQSLRLPGATAERVHVTFAGPSLFTVLRAKPALGRMFTGEDARPGFMDMTWQIPVLISHELWVGRFGADPNVIGRLITLGDNRREIVGVMPEGFEFPAGTEIWLLFEPPTATQDFARSFPYDAVARMRTGVSAGAAQADLERALPQIVGAYRDATPQRLAEIRLAPIVTPLKAAVIGDMGHVLWTLFAGLGVLLFIACASAASLFAARAEQRRREIALRFALGAERRQVARVFFVEALVLTTMASAAGLLIAGGLVWMVVSFSPVDLPRIGEIRIDGAAVVFGGLLAVSMAAFYSVLSLRRQDRPPATDRSSPFVVLQVGLALALMIASALMVRTYRNLSERPLGFSPDRVLTVEIGLSGREASRHARIYGDLVERIRQLPGVESASMVSFLPLTPSGEVFPLEKNGAPVLFKFFVPGYFQAMKIPIVQGATFAPGEIVPAPYPVIVSASLARRLYPGEQALGRNVRRLNHDGTPVDRNGIVPPFTIAGIAGDVRETTLRGDPSDVVYVPAIEPSVEQSIVPINMTLTIRADESPLALVPLVREAIGAVNPNLTIAKVRTMDAIVRRARAREGFVGALLLLAAVASLFLGVVGVYGSVAHAARHRTRELGIRTALGARRIQLIRLVMTGSMRAVLAGAGLGLIVAFIGARMLGALLFGVPPHDPLTFALSTTLLIISAGSAALAAARQATRIAPIAAMRSE